MHRPVFVAFAAALLLGCPQSGSSDGTATAESSGSESTSTSSDPSSESLTNSGPTTDPDPTTDTTLTTDPDSSSTEPGTESSSGGDQCTEKDECIVDEDCLLGQSCLGCLCFGEPKGGCAEWGDGAWGNCVEEGNTVCDGGTCLGAGEGVGICFFSPCETPCDCPQPPKGFEEQVTCASITMGDETLDCYIGCGGGAECPEGMGCVQNTICMFGVEEGVDYGNCVATPPDPCDGVCLSNNPLDPAWGFCGGGCMEDGDCSTPETGDAVANCIDYSGEGDMACVLACGANTVCPDGMYCETEFGICAWDVAEPWSNCIDDPPQVCPTDHTCVSTEADVGVCGGPCDDVMDCDPAPATGTAVAQCTDLGAGNVCNLGCAMGETCPDGMACVAETYCAFTLP